jgi:heat shock protein HslJ/uncharacterized membrane protein
MLARRLLLALALGGCSSGGGTADGARTRAADTTRGGGALPDSAAAARTDTSRRNGIALPFRARGNEPGWSLDVGARELTLLADYGERKVVAPTPAPTTSGDTTRWATRAQGHVVVITVVDRLCHDGMSGFPFPRTVVVRLDDREHAGCGGETVDVLVGPAWTVREIDGAAVPQDTPPRLEFLANGRVSGRGPCNGVGGSYELRGDELSFPQLAVTKMACADPVMERERGFLALLGAVRRFERTGDSLILRTEDGRSITARR